MKKREKRVQMAMVIATRKGKDRRLDAVPLLCAGLRRSTFDPDTAHMKLMTKGTWP